jgi:hypothetical protein
MVYLCDCPIAAVPLLFFELNVGINEHTETLVANVLQMSPNMNHGDK